MIEARVAQLERELSQAAKEGTACKLLLSIPGVGLLTATAMVAATSGKVTHFKDARHFANWFGLTPKEHSSGSTRHLCPRAKQSQQGRMRLGQQNGPDLLRRHAGWLETENPIHPPQLCIEISSPIMAPRIILAPPNADNFAGSLLVVRIDWGHGARRFHVGQSQSELIKQAGYTTAGYILRANKPISLLLYFWGSPYT